jgi:hypothetical protein
MHVRTRLEMAQSVKPEEQVLVVPNHAVCKFEFLLDAT